MAGTAMHPVGSTPPPPRCAPATPQRRPAAAGLTAAPGPPAAVGPGWPPGSPGCVAGRCRSGVAGPPRPSAHHRGASGDSDSSGARGDTRGFGPPPPSQKWPESRPGRARTAGVRRTPSGRAGPERLAAPRADASRLGPGPVPGRIVRPGCGRGKARPGRRRPGARAAIRRAASRSAAGHCGPAWPGRRNHRRAGADAGSGGPRNLPPPGPRRSPAAGSPARPGPRPADAPSPAAARGGPRRGQKRRLPPALTAV
jgi:hypothetical protein